MFELLKHHYLKQLLYIIFLKVYANVTLLFLNILATCYHNDKSVTDKKVSKLHNHAFLHHAVVFHTVSQNLHSHKNYDWSIQNIMTMRLHGIGLLSRLYHMSCLPRILLAKWMSFGIIVTRFAWIAHRLASSNRWTRNASAA